jgi:carbamoyl-phosphate synthase large subunit
MSDKAKALVIAGGQWQVPIIKFLQSKNYDVFVVDPYDTSPGVLIANNHIKEDVRDVNNIIKKIGNTKFEIVTSDQSDISVETVATLASRLSLIGNDIEVVRLFTNKFLSREYSVSQGIPVPKFFKATNLDDVRLAISQLKLPVIFKPVDSQSSRGIFKIDETNIADYKDMALLTFSESKSKYILVEEFFTGIELTLEGICSNRKHRTVAISQKKHFRTGIASDLLYPAQLEFHIEKQLVDYNDRYVENSGLNFGITHAEYLFDSITEEIKLVEIACRGGGSLISSDIAKWVSGIDLYQILFDDLRGISTDVKSFLPLRKSALLHFFEYPSGKVKEIFGVEEVLKIEGVKMLKLDFTLGDIINKAKDDRSRQGFVIIFAETQSQLEIMLKKLESTLKVNVETI